jgi:tyrosine-protein phosphatase YwqE
MNVEGAGMTASQVNHRFSHMIKQSAQKGKQLMSAKLCFAVDSDFHAFKEKLVHRMALFKQDKLEYIENINYGGFLTAQVNFNKFLSMNETDFMDYADTGDIILFRTRSASSWI